MLLGHPFSHQTSHGALLLTHGGTAPGDYSVKNIVDNAVKLHKSIQYEMPILLDTNTLVMKTAILDCKLIYKKISSYVYIHVCVHK